MSDEYSLAGRFLMEKDSAEEYVRRMARLQRLRDEAEADIERSKIDDKPKEQD